MPGASMRANVTLESMSCDVGAVRRFFFGFRTRSTGPGGVPSGLDPIGGVRVLEFMPGPLVCGDQFLTPREVRHRLHEAYRDALEKHGQRDRLCPQRAGKCPEEIAGSVRRLFALPRPLLARLASPESKVLDFPPAFGFSEPWVQKLDRCGREA